MLIGRLLRIIGGRTPPPTYKREFSCDLKPVPVCARPPLAFAIRRPGVFPSSVFAPGGFPPPKGRRPGPTPDGRSISCEKRRRLMRLLPRVLRLSLMVLRIAQHRCFPDSDFPEIGVMAALPLRALYPVYKFDVVVCNGERCVFSDHKAGGYT